MCESSSSSGRVVLVAVDGSDHSRNAFDYFLKFIRRPDDKVVILHVFAAIDTPLMPDQLAFTEWNRLAKLKRYELGLLKQSFVEAADKAGVEVIVTLRQNNSPGQEIVSEAKFLAASQIVVGSRGLGMIRRTLLGSVSDYVLHHSNIPITVVHLQK